MLNMIVYFTDGTCWSLAVDHSEVAELTAIWDANPNVDHWEID